MQTYHFFTKQTRNHTRHLTWNECLAAALGVEEPAELADVDGVTVGVDGVVGVDRDGVGVDGVVDDVVPEVREIQSSTALFSPRRNPSSVKSVSFSRRSCRSVMACSAQDSDTRSHTRFLNQSKCSPPLPFIIISHTYNSAISQSVSFITCEASQSKYSKHRTNVKERQHEAIKLIMFIILTKTNMENDQCYPTFQQRSSIYNI